jgi:hypothetical protein
LILVRFAPTAARWANLWSRLTALSFTKCVQYSYSIQYCRALSAFSVPGSISRLI